MERAGRRSRDTVIYAAITVIGSRNKQIDTVNVTELDPKRSLRLRRITLDGRDREKERLQCL
jgi:hypothetical protein